MKAGFIGYRNFAGRLKDLFEQSDCVKEFLFFHPNKIIDNISITNKLSDLFGCDFIVIASPDYTHGSYLMQLQEYDRYIFCEKIPITNRKDLLFLKNNPNPFLYFDFNYRKSFIYELFLELSGSILYINHSFGNGLALKETYRTNWRSNISTAPLGVFQLSGVHFFDLLLYCFGRPISCRVTARNLSPYGNSIDNFGINIDHHSLKKSINYFLDVVQSKGKFPEALAENNLLSTELFLDFLDDLEKFKK